MPHWLIISSRAKFVYSISGDRGFQEKVMWSINFLLHLEIPGILGISRLSKYNLSFLLVRKWYKKYDSGTSFSKDQPSQRKVFVVQFCMYTRSHKTVSHVRITVILYSDPHYCEWPRSESFHCNWHALGHPGQAALKNKAMESKRLGNCPGSLTLQAGILPMHHIDCPEFRC